MRYLAVVRKPPSASPIAVVIDALDDAGAGVGSDGATRVHVAGALPGERVTATIAHRSPHQREAWATLQTIDPGTRSPDRQPPTCAAFGACGGCALGHLGANAQARWKEAQLRALVTPPALVRPIVESERTVGYRNQSKLVVGRRGVAPGELVLGGYAPRSHTIVDLTTCTLVEPPLQAATIALREALAASPIAIYDEPTKSGELRYVLLRANRHGELLATLVTRSAVVKHLDDLIKQLVDRLAGLVGVVQSLNASDGNALYGAEHRLRWGADRFVESIAGLGLEVSYRAFFQINRGIAERMWQRGRALAAERSLGSARVVDVYCGVGGFGLALGGEGPLVGIEVVEPAVEAARANAARAGRAARFVAGDAAPLLGTLDRADLVLLNPPRRGCDPEVLAAVARLRPTHVFYMSCEPKTLVRDLARLAPLGYHATTIEPFDMMPHTPHYEVLAVLDRAG